MTTFYIPICNQKNEHIAPLAIFIEYSPQRKLVQLLIVSSFYICNRKRSVMGNMKHDNGGDFKSYNSFTTKSAITHMCTHTYHRIEWVKAVSRVTEAAACIPNYPLEVSES